jgi:hypothetical protein
LHSLQPMMPALGENMINPFSYFYGLVLLSTRLIQLPKIHWMWMLFLL